MSLQYLLDGYNIIHKIPQLNQGSFESARINFLQWLERDRPQGNNKVIVVFDGQAGTLSWADTPKSIQVVFTASTTADSWIKKYVVESSAKKSLVVVTDDREIQVYVRKCGTTVVPVSKFIAFQGFSKHSRSKKSSYSKQDDSVHSIKKISIFDQNKINQELENLWLTDD